MTDVQISLGTAECHAGAEVAVGMEGIASAEPPLWENTSVFTTGDYVVVDGQPRADATYGTKQVSLAGYDALTQVTTQPDKRTLFPDAYAHWVVDADDLGVETPPFRRWWPVGSAKTSESARMSMFSTLEGSSNGADQYIAGVSPDFDLDYRYQGFSQGLAKPASVFQRSIHTDGQKRWGRMKIDPEGTFESVTLAITAVLHPGFEAYYGIFEAAQILDVSSNTLIGDPLVLRYHHGQVRLYHAEQLVLTHETQKPAAGPTIMLLALDSVTDEGKFMCLDQTRTTRTFNTAGMEYVSLLGSIGALGQGVDDNPYRLNAEMDLLDVCMWTEALDWYELEAAANLLNLTYGETW